MPEPTLNPEPVLNATAAPVPAGDPPAGGSGPAALYRAALGPLNAERYLQVFERFDATGRRRPVWHGPAALFTLGWLVLRRLWGPALLYALLLAAVVGLGLVAWPLLVAWPPGVRYGLLGFLSLLWFLWPGWLAHALLHRQVQRRILRAVGSARTMAEAQQRLRAGGVGPERLRHVVSGFGLLLSGLLFLGAWQPWQPAVPPPPVAAASAPTPVGAPVTVRVPTPTPTPTPVAPVPLPEPEPEPEPEPVQASAVTTATVAVAAPAPAPLAASPATVAGFGINVGLFASADNAQRAHQRLLQARLPATVEVLHSPKGERFRVRVEPFDDAAAAEAAAVQVRLLGLDAVVFSFP